jgi:hypothetical protein
MKHVKKISVMKAASISDTLEGWWQDITDWFKKNS